MGEGDGGRLVGRWKEEGTGSWEVDGVKKVKCFLGVLTFNGENGREGVVEGWWEDGRMRGGVVIRAQIMLMCGLRVIN